MPAAIDVNHILESVLRVWREDGYRRATTRKVAALANISEVTLFRRFGDKAALFRAAFEREAERFTADAVAPSGDLEADLEQVVRAYAALLDRSAPIIFDFLLEAPRTPELARMRPVPLTAITRVAALVAGHQASGKLRDGSAFHAVLALLSPLVMTALLSRSQPALVAPEDPAERVRAFLSGWSAEEIRK